VVERYQRSEKAWVPVLSEMYIQGVSTRKVKAVTEELCGHGFSASAISRINSKLDEELAKFAGRQLEGPYPYLVLDARYEKVWAEGVFLLPSAAKNNVDLVGVDDGYTIEPEVTRLVEGVSYTNSPDQALVHKVVSKVARGTTISRISPHGNVKGGHPCSAASPST
jgi:hypothetical protein